MRRALTPKIGPCRHTLNAVSASCAHTSVRKCPSPVNKSDLLSSGCSHACAARGRQRRNSTTHARERRSPFASRWGCNPARKKPVLGLPRRYQNAAIRLRWRHAAIREADPVPTNWRDGIGHRCTSRHLLASVTPSTPRNPTAYAYRNRLLGTSIAGSSCGQRFNAPVRSGRISGKLRLQRALRTRHIPA